MIVRIIRVGITFWVMHFFHDFYSISTCISLHWMITYHVILLRKNTPCQGRDVDARKGPLLYCLSNSWLLLCCFSFHSIDYSVSSSTDGVEVTMSTFYENITSSSLLVIQWNLEYMNM